MSEKRIIPIVMPKWGLSMSEGKVTGWLVKDGTKINVGDQILEVETDKIAGAVEATDAGILRRVIGQPDTVYPVKALMGVLTEEGVPDSEIDAFVESYVVPATEEGEADAGPQYEYADTPAGKLRYAKRGDGGETVILIHGFGGDLDNWLFNIDAIAENATVYALDLPGHGQSAKSITDPSVAGLANAVIGFMDKVGIAKAHLVGHSLGGATAIAVAQADKKRVKSLTLISSAGLGSDINDAYISGFVSAQSRRDMKPVLSELFADPSLVSRDMIDNILKYKRLDGVTDALTSLKQGVFAGGKQSAILADALKSSGVPALVIWGAEDKIVPANHAKAASGARVEIIDGAGHMVQMEQASKVNALIKSEIARAA
jgi:pyruvate dehydrogenase E2 component (dihydrolipoamide acetyltransferase)